MQYELLEKIISQPAAPFRELHVIEAITQILDEHSIPYFRDQTQNIIIGASSRKAYQALLNKVPKNGKPLPVFIAHMDHPGFHGVRWTSPSAGLQLLEIEWHGGAPTQLLEGASVWLADSKGFMGHGTLAGVVLHESGKTISKAQVKIQQCDRGSLPKASQVFGGFRFRATHWKEKDFLYTKAADDLVGSFAIISKAIDNSKLFSKGNAPFIGLLTRAEEVGFIGCIGHFQEGFFKKAKRPLLFVSLETSRTLPGAEMGWGPIVRLGDKAGVFSAGETREFVKLAEKTLKTKFQKRIMDAGTCEATVSMANGFKTIAISIPLGNYHNQSFEGGPDSRGSMGPAPEFVHLGDLDGMLTLCQAIIQNPPQSDAVWKDRILEFKKGYSKYKPLLKYS